MTDVLEFPTIEEQAPAPVAPKTELATAAHAALDLAKIDLTDVAIAQFGNWRAHVASVKANLSTLALDLSTQAKIDEARSLRHRLIGQPRAEARKVSKELKSKLAKVSKAIGAEEDAAVDAYNAAEDLITPQIDARQAELDAEKEAAKAAEAARVQKHQDGIATIRSYLGMAKGLPSSRIALGIEKLRGMSFGPEWEEFAVQAADAQCQTIEALRNLLAETQAAEAAAAEQARIAAEHADLQQAAAINARAIACAGKTSAEIKAAIKLLDATTYPEDVAACVTAAHGQALALLTTLCAAALASEQAADAAREAAARAAEIQAPPVAPVADGSQDSDDAAAIPGAKAGPDTPEGVQPRSERGREGMAPEACESAAGRGTDGAPALATHPHHESPGVGPMGVGQPADAGPAADEPEGSAGAACRAEEPKETAQRGAVGHGAGEDAKHDGGPALPNGPADFGSLETSEREAVEPEPCSTTLHLTIDSSVVKELASALTDLEPLLRECLQLVEHLEGPFTGKFPTQPKPDATWWAVTRRMRDSLQPRLQYAVGIQAGEA